MRWVVLFLIGCVPIPIQSQSVQDFPSIPSVSQVTIVGYVLIFNLAPAVPPPEFAIWWEEMEACTGLRADYEAIQWYQATQLIHPIEQAAYWGVYFKTPPEIIILRNMVPARLENTVKHEMLHHLIQKGGHDEELFNRCLPFGMEHD